MFRTWLLLTLAVILIPQQQQQPAFRSGVDVIVVDAHVVDRHGMPILGLTPADFEVHVAGERRRVISADLVSYGEPTAAPPSVSSADASAADGTSRPRRMFVLAVDEHSLHTQSARAAVAAAEKFIDRLQPDDLVGLYAYPTGAAQHDLTTDHASVRRALKKIDGLLTEPMSTFKLTPSEALDIANRNQQVLATVLARECPRPLPGCRSTDISAEATSMAGFMEMQVSQSLGGLRALTAGLADIPGRKILVLVSGGLITNDTSGSRGNAAAQLNAVGREAALANVSLFALHLDWSFITAQLSKQGLRTSIFRDGNLAASGLERLAGTAGGSVMRVFGTSPDTAFERVLRETSAHYLLGVEASGTDRDGRAKAIRVGVRKRGAHVRSRSQLIVPPK